MKKVIILAAVLVMACLSSTAVGALAEFKISLNWQTRPEGKQARNDEIRRRRAAGEKLRELSDSLGVSLQRIGQIVAKG
jgi:cell division protein ZapA (FtsZ GTPase activity inhibitor)